MTGELATLDEPIETFGQDQVSTAALVLGRGALDRLTALATMMAKGKATVPAHLQGNVGDCLAVCMQATQWGMNPFAVAQKTHVVQGTLGYEAQLVNAVITTMAPTKDRLHFEWFGDWAKIVGKFKEVESKTKKDDNGNFKKFRVPAWDVKDEEGLGVKVWATMKGENEPRELELLMTQARTRNSGLWTEDPKQQLAYLATKRWSRLYCPDVILGVYTPDELNDGAPPKDMGAAEVVEEEGLPEKTLAAWRLDCERGTAAARAFWKNAGEEFRRRAIKAGQDKSMWQVAVEADAKRTVDNAPKTDAPAPTADPVKDSFVADMERAERAEQEGAAS